MTAPTGGPETAPASGGQGAPPAPPDPQADELDAETTTEDPAKLREALKRSRNEARSAKTQVSALKVKAEQWDTHEQSLKTEQQKAQEAAEQALASAASQERELLKLRAAIKAGFTGDQAEEMAGRLRGNTAEELSADAVSLFDLIGEKTGQSRRPAPDRTQGTTSGGATTDPHPLLAMLHEKLGRG